MSPETIPVANFEVNLRFFVCDAFFKTSRTSQPNRYAGKSRGESS